MLHSTLSSVENSKGSSFQPKQGVSLEQGNLLASGKGNLKRKLPVVTNTQRAPESLPEFSLYQPRIGHPDWKRLESEAKALADKLLPLLEKPRSPSQDALRKARSLGTVAVNYLENKRRTKAGREDLLPLYFIWTTLRNCNFSCSYCDDHRGHKYPDLSDEGLLSTDQGKQLLNVMRTRASSVYFAGGEPTLRKDLPELTRHARDVDYYPLIINTNGSAIDKLLVKPHYKTWLADMDVIIVSLDGLELSWLAQTWGYRDAEAVIRNILLLRHLSGPMGFKLGVNVVVQPGQVEHARDVLDFANDMGLWVTPVPMNRGPKIAEGFNTDYAYQAFCRLVLERKKKGYRITGSHRLNARLLSSAPLNCRNTLKPHIDFDGSLYWPCKATVAVDPIKESVLAHKDVDSLWAECTKRQDPRDFSKKCGASCNWAQNYSTDAYVHGLEHPLALVREMGEFLMGAGGY